MTMERKTVVVFGGSGPLGSVVCQNFLKAGANVALSWNSPEPWAQTEALLAPYAKRLLSQRVNVADESEVSAFVEAVRTRWGAIDVMLYMAGCFKVGPMLWQTQPDDFDKMLSVNLRGAFLAVRATVPVMLEKGCGQLFFFPAKSVLAPRARFGAYAVTKGALVTLTESLAEELKETGITVNAVMPDAVDTYKTRMAPGATPDKWVKPQEVADLLLAVCTPPSHILNGATLKVYGK